MVSSSPAAAGWYPDPTGRGEFRWWTGTQWTYRLASGGQLYSESTGDLSALPPPRTSGPVATDGQVAPRGTRSREAQPAAVRLGTQEDIIDVRLSAGAAFKAGFFGFWGAAAASLMLSVVLLLLAVVFAVCTAASIRPPTNVP